MGREEKGKEGRREEKGKEGEGRGGMQLLPHHVPLTCPSHDDGNTLTTCH